MIRLQQMPLPDMLREMETSGEGYGLDHGGVDEFEFVLANLLLMDKITSADVEPILHRFAAMDLEGNGLLTQRDLLRVKYEAPVKKQMNKGQEGGKTDDDGTKRQMRASQQQVVEGAGTIRRLSDPNLQMQNANTNDASKK
jgi:hypothetical protein